MFWNPNFLTSTAITVCGMIKSFEYQINNSWKAAKIISTGQESSGDAYHVYNYFFLEIPSTTEGTITGFRVTDSSGKVIGSKVENIVKSAGTAMIYKFKLRIYEEGK